MVTITNKSINETETVVGKNVIENIETIEKATLEVLKDNKDLRRVENRHLVKLLVEQKLGRRVADESVPRACRAIQNTEGLWNPDPKDNRKELEEINEGYYSHKEEETRELYSKKLADVLLDDSSQLGKAEGRK